MTIARVYPQFHMSALSGQVNLATDALRILLLSSTYAPNLDTHRYASSLTGELSTGSGYTAGGQLLTGVALTYDAATDTTWLDANNPVWDPSTLTARYAVLVDVQSGSAATNPLVVYWDFEENKSSDNAPFELNINALGLLRTTANPA